jgi:hypothetical protein
MLILWAHGIDSHKYFITLARIEKGLGGDYLSKCLFSCLLYFLLIIGVIFRFEINLYDFSSVDLILHSC